MLCAIFPLHFFYITTYFEVHAILVYREIDRLLGCGLVWAPLGHW